MFRYKCMLQPDCAGVLNLLYTLLFVCALKNQLWEVHKLSKEELIAHL